jgi:hypothetical protein
VYAIPGSEKERKLPTGFVNGDPKPADHAIARGQFDSIKVQSGVTVPGMKGYNARFYLCRPFQSWNGRHIPAQDFVNAVAADIAPLAAAGVEYFEFQNEPNLTHEGLSAHGVVGSWRDGSEFARYFIEGRKLLRQRFPGINVGFPGLSPGPDAPYQFGHDRGFRTNHREFLDGAVVTIREAKEFYRLVGQIPGIAPPTTLLSPARARTSRHCAVRAMANLQRWLRLRFD